MVDGLLRDLPGGAGLLSPSPADNSTGLTPASRRQDHTTWPYASAFSSGMHVHARRQSVHRIPRPTFRDDREAPLVWARDGGGSSADLGLLKSRIYLISGLDFLFLITRRDLPRASPKATPGTA